MQKSSRVKLHATFSRGNSGRQGSWTVQRSIQSILTIWLAIFRDATSHCLLQPQATDVYGVSSVEAWNARRAELIEMTSVKSRPNTPKANVQLNVQQSHGCTTLPGSSLRRRHRASRSMNHYRSRVSQRPDRQSEVVSTSFGRWSSSESVTSEWRHRCA